MINIDPRNRLDLDISQYNFLLAFKRKGEIVHYRVLNYNTRYSEKYSSKLDCENSKYKAINQTLLSEQEEGNGIFFVVNSGGTKNVQINKITAYFIDFDLCKYDTGEKNEEDKTIWGYHTPQELEELKQQSLKELDKFPLEPSIIVETKNGFHVYWLADREKVCEVDKFTSIQRALIGCFDKYSDDSIFDLARVMRIPNYFHLKEIKKPFRIKCIKFNPELKYSQYQLLEHLDINIEEIAITNDIDNDIEVKNPTGENGIFDNYAEIIDYIKKQNFIPVLSKYIPSFNIAREGTKFLCPFHNEKTPSAVVNHTRKGYYKFKCFGKNCDTHVKGESIIDLIIRVSHDDLGYKDAVKILMGEFNIKLRQTEWIIDQEEKYKFNRIFINSRRMSREFREKYPNFHKVMDIGWTWAIFNRISDIGSIHINEQYQYKNQSIVFFSNRFIKEIYKEIPLDDINRYINLLVTLGLIEKVNSNDLPKNLFERAYQEYKNNDESEALICFYIVNDISRVVKKAEQIAKVLVNDNFILHNMGSRYLYLLFGQEFASNVYQNGKQMDTIIRKEQALYKAIEYDLKNKGYIAPTEIKKRKIEYMQSREGKREYLNSKDMRFMLPYCIEKFIEMHSEIKIKKKKLNKELKEKLDVKIKGYGYIYIPMD